MSKRKADDSGTRKNYSELTTQTSNQTLQYTDIRNFFHLVL